MSPMPSSTHLTAMGKPTRLSSPIRPTGTSTSSARWLDEKYRKDLTDLDNLLLTTKNSEPVFLKILPRFDWSSGPAKIYRKYFQRVIHITANPVWTGSRRDCRRVLKPKLADMQFSQGFTVRLSGQIQQQRETFEGLVFATILAIMLVYMVMAAQFKSLIDPFIIRFAVPLGLPGVILTSVSDRTRRSRRRPSWARS